MPVGVIQLAIHLPESHSRKDRRAVVRSVKDRLRAHFNVSVAELDEGETLWQRAQLGIAAIASDRTYLEGLLTKAGAAAAEILRGQQVEVGEVEILD